MQRSEAQTTARTTQNWHPVHLALSGSGSPMMPDHAQMDDFECTTRPIPVDDLFEWYSRSGFLYPEKYELLRPYLPTIRENWRRLLSSDEQLLFVVRHNWSAESGSTVASFRTNAGSWHTQHLVSRRDTLGSASVIQATCVHRTRNSSDRAHQMWFRPDNKFPSRVFGSMVSSLGDQSARVENYAYCQWQLRAPKLPFNGFVSGRVSSAFGTSAVTQLRGAVYSLAEGYLEDDLNLSSTDAMYREAGLRRYRRVFEIRRSNGELAGFCAAYRGPLGLNFSFLENRAEVTLAPALSEQESEQAIACALVALQSCYDDYEVPWAPLLIHGTAPADLSRIGVRRLRSYNQGICVRSGFEQWYGHVGGIFARATSRRQFAGVVS